MKTYTGQLGVVLICDDATNGKAIAIANAAPKGSEIKLGTQHHPHITLYHSKLKDVSESIVRELLDVLVVKLPVDLKFKQTAIFGGKFLFWDNERTPELLDLHAGVLGLSRYFIPAGEQQADKEKIILSPEEDENVRLYGHPLVRGLWRPHITLGYYPAGIAQDAQEEKYFGEVCGVAFVRVGDFGTIKEVITEVGVTQRKSSRRKMW
ncbi:MAG: 2'-5' RNA ligase family protein [Parcubacteria group bacterium]|nr:2'-5' RNA ligase family protein [Parcubacteria group bacterium]